MTEPILPAPSPARSPAGPADGTGREPVTDAAAEPAPAATAIDWPPLPAGASPPDTPGQLAGPIGRILGPLAALPANPVAGHGASYELMHTELLQVLDEDLGAAGEGTDEPA